MGEYENIIYMGIISRIRLIVAGWYFISTVYTIVKMGICNLKLKHITDTASDTVLEVEEIEKILHGGY